MAFEPVNLAPNRPSSLVLYYSLPFSFVLQLYGLYFQPQKSSSSLLRSFISWGSPSMCHSLYPSSPLPTPLGSSSSGSQLTCHFYRVVELPCWTPPNLPSNQVRSPMVSPQKHPLFFLHSIYYSYRQAHYLRNYLMPPSLNRLKLQ